MKINLKLLGIFKKNKTVKPTFSDYALIKLTDTAKNHGITDDFNKVIVIFRNGKKDIKPYSEELVDTLEEIEKIPVTEETLDEDYDFLEVPGFGEIG